MFKKLLLFVLCFIAILSVGFNQWQKKPQLAGGFNVTGGTTYYLNSSVGTGDTTLHLASFKEPISNIPYTMSYLNTDKVYFTLDPQTSRSEFGSFTGITQNSDGSANITGVTRGLSRTPGTGGCVASTTLAQSHAGRSIFILSNSPCFYSEYMPIRTTATSSAVLVFGSTTAPRYDSVGVQGTGSMFSTTSELASVAYVNSVALVSSPNGSESVKGVWQGATALQSASSTITGGTGAGLVLQAQYATDTRNSATAGSKVLMSSIGGYLSQAWIDLTQAFTFAKLTTTATTTIPASSTTSNPLILNSLAYQWPANRGASSTALMENGSGSLSFNYPSSRCYVVATSSDPFGYQNTSYNATYTHGLGQTPTLVRARWDYHDAVGTIASNFGTGVATTTGATGGYYSTTYLPVSVVGIDTAGNNTNFISMRGNQGSANTEFVTAYVSSWSSTNVVINWTSVNGGFNANDSGYSVLLEICL